MKLSEKVSILRDIIKLQLNAIDKYYQKSNVILVISGLLLSFTLSGLLKNFPQTPIIKGMTILMILFSLAAVALILIFIRPQMLEGRAKGLFYKDLQNPPSFHKYLNELEETFKSQSKVVAMYTSEIQNLGEILKPLVKIVRVSIVLLLSSLVIGLIAIILSLF